MDISTRSKRNSKNDGSLVLTIRPRRLEIMELGTYPGKNLVPEFSFDFLPDIPDAMGMSLIETEGSDGVRVAAQFQNYANETIMVFGRRLTESGE